MIIGEKYPKKDECLLGEKLMVKHCNSFLFLLKEAAPQLYMRGVFQTNFQTHNFPKMWEVGAFSSLGACKTSQSLIHTQEWQCI